MVRLPLSLRVRAARTLDIIRGAPEAVMAVVNSSSYACTASASRPWGCGSWRASRGAGFLRRWARCSAVRWATSAR